MMDIDMILKIEVRTVRSKTDMNFIVNISG